MDLVTIATAELTPIGDDGPQNHPALLVIWGADRVCCLGITKATVKRLARQGAPFVETPTPRLLSEIRAFYMEHGLAMVEQMRRAVYGEATGSVQ